jgi:TolB protein
MHRSIIVPVLAAAALAAAGCQRAESAEPGTASLSRGELRGLRGSIVFVSERDGHADVYAVRPDGRGLRRLTEAASQDYPAAPSPDGASLLTVSTVGEGQSQRERMALLPLRGGGAIRPVGPLAGRSRSPSWSPDGTWLVFESDSASFRDLYRVQADGTGLIRITSNPEGNFDPAVSPDGRSIAFVSSRDGDAEVYVMRADGGEPRRLTAFHRDDWAPHWSPDGGRIAFLSNRDGVDRVYVSEADPAWSPDGRRMALTLRTRGGGSVVGVAETAGGPVRVVSGVDEAASMPAWSPDGRHLVYVADRGDDADLRVVRADGSAGATVVRSPGPDWLPRWVP